MESQNCFKFFSKNCDLFPQSSKFKFKKVLTNTKSNHLYFILNFETHMRTFVNDVTGGGGTHFCETSYKGFLKTDF